MDDIFELVKSRHSVRSYTDKPIDGNVKEELENIIEKCNNAGKLNIKLFLNEPKAFDTFMAHYGKFNNVKNVRLFWSGNSYESARIRTEYLLGSYDLRKKKSTV